MPSKSSLTFKSASFSASKFSSRSACAPEGSTRPPTRRRMSSLRGSFGRTSRSKAASTCSSVSLYFSGTASSSRRSSMGRIGGAAALAAARSDSSRRLSAWSSFTSFRSDRIHCNSRFIIRTLTLATDSLDAVVSPTLVPFPFLASSSPSTPPSFPSRRMPSSTFTSVPPPLATRSGPLASSSTPPTGTAITVIFPLAVCSTAVAPLLFPRWFPRGGGRHAFFGLATATSHVGVCSPSVALRSARTARLRSPTAVAPQKYTQGIHVGIPAQSGFS